MVLILLQIKSRIASTVFRPAPVCMPRYRLCEDFVLNLDLKHTMMVGCNLYISCMIIAIKSDKAVYQGVRGGIIPADHSL